MIYFAQAEEIGSIKIGYTGDTDARPRLQDVQVGCPARLVLLGTIPGTRETETDLHRRFAFAHIHGDWFRPMPELLQFIGTEVKDPRSGPAEVATRFVQVKVLTVNSRSFTATMLRQLPNRHIIEPGVGLRGEPWGVVNYHWDQCGCFGGYRNVVWVSDGVLYRSCIGSVQASDIVHLGYEDETEIRGDLQAIDWIVGRVGGKIITRFRNSKTPANFKEMIAWWNEQVKQLEALEQLYIAV